MEKFITRSEIGKKMGVSGTTVHTCLVKAGIKAVKSECIGSQLATMFYDAEEIEKANLIQYTQKGKRLEKKRKDKELLREEILNEISPKTPKLSDVFPEILIDILRELENINKNISKLVKELS